MKTTNYCLVAFSAFLLTACSNPQNQTNTDLVQYQEEVLDGPIKRVVLNTKNLQLDLNEEKEAKEELDNLLNPIPTKQVHQAPQKTLDELGHEISKIIEQGSDDEYAANTYVEYGDALTKAEIYSDALYAYADAEKLGYKDLKNLYYKMARVYAFKNEYYGSVEDHLLKARKEGFRNYRALLYDAAFEKMRTDGDFMYSYQELFGDSKKAMFKAFVVLAPKDKLTEDYAINTATLFEKTDYDYRTESGYYEKSPVISGYYEAVIKGISDDMFSREGGDVYRYEMVLVDNPNYLMVVYSKEDSWVEYLLPKTYKLATYDWEGNVISELELAKKGSLKNCKTAVLKTNKTIVVTNNKVTWKKDTKSRAGDDYDQLLNHQDLDVVEASKTKTYFINDNGRILESEPVVLGMR